jgi:hypothetical protein
MVVREFLAKVTKKRAKGETSEDVKAESYKVAPSAISELTEATPGDGKKLEPAEGITREPKDGKETQTSEQIAPEAKSDSQHVTEPEVRISVSSCSQLPMIRENIFIQDVSTIRDSTRCSE